MLGKFSYLRARTLDGAFDRLQGEDTRIHAGGTDLLGCLREGVFPASRIVSLSRLGELRGISETADGGLRIGALTTIADVAADPIVIDRYPGLAEAAADVASPQLRNQGTLGGNLCQKPRCWYYRGEFHCLRKGGTACFAADGENEYHCIFGGDGCYIVHPSDTAPVLCALEARIRVKRGKSERMIPVAEMHVPPSVDPTRETVLRPDEILTDILLPAPAAGLRSTYRKVRARGSWDFALAGAALALEFGGSTVRRARVYLSGAAPVPWRARGAEEAITGRKLTPAVVNAAAEAAVAGAEPLAKNGYKLPLFRGIIQEELARIAR